jgi:polyisoprenoid-binding protein YceI
MKGLVHFNPDDLGNSAFDVCMDASSLNSGNKMRDKHLRSEDFFFVEKYPEICFVSDSIEKEGDHFVTRGKLTIRDVSREIQIPFTFDGQVLQGSLLINRFEYDLGTDVGTFKASKEATITILCKLE